MSQEDNDVDDTPRKFEHNGIEYNVYPRVDRETIPLNEYQSDLPEEEQDILDHEEARFHDTRDIRTEKELTGWVVSYGGSSTWLSSDEYATVEEVVDTVEDTIDSGAS